MEQTSINKRIFQNYLRSLYVELTPEESSWIKSKLASVDSPSWCAVVQNVRLSKGLLAYYLIASKFPEYKCVSSVDVLEGRFDEEENRVTPKELIAYPGILIIRHSNSNIRNKIMFETVKYVVSERSYLEKPTVVVSNVQKDSGDYIYYNHDYIKMYIPCDISDNIPKSASMPLAKDGSRAKTSGFVPSSSSCKPLAALKSEKKDKEQELKNRSKFIEETAKSAI